MISFFSRYLSFSLQFSSPFFFADRPLHGGDHHYTLAGSMASVAALAIVVLSTVSAAE